MIRWWARKFRYNDYIFKDDLEVIILKAKKKEAEQLKKLHVQEIIDIEALKDMERNIEVSELRAEIAQLQEELNGNKKRNKETKEFYYKVLRKAKENAKITAETRLNNFMTIENIAELQSNLEKTNNTALLHVAKLEDKRFKDGII